MNLPNRIRRWLAARYLYKRLDRIGMPRSESQPLVEYVLDQQEGVEFVFFRSLHKKGGEALKWYEIHCPECKWVTPIVSEDVAIKFREVLRYCQDCKVRGKKVEFRYREIITSTLKGPSREVGS